MEGTHNLYKGETWIGLSPEELAALHTVGEVQGEHPGLGNRVDIFKYSVMNNQSEGQHYAPSARFDPNGNLSIALPMTPKEELVLPLTIPFVEIKPSSHTRIFYGTVAEKAGGIVVAAAAPKASAKAKKLANKRAGKTRTS